MRRTLKIFFYAVYAVFACIFFAIYLFPSDLAKDYIRYQCRLIDPSLSVKIGQVRLVFPPAIRIRALDLAYSDEPYLLIDMLQIRPVFGSLWTGRPQFSIRGSAHEGRFQGNIEQTAPESAGAFSLDLAFSKVQAEELPLLKNRSNYRFSGRLDGKVHYEIQPDEQTGGQAEILASDCRIKLNESLLNAIEFSFNKIETAFRLQGSSLIVERAAAFGEQMNASAAGTIELRRPAGYSLLDLEVKIQPRPDAFAEFKGDLIKGLIAMIKSAFSIKVTGSLDRPEYYFNSDIYLN